MCVAHLQYSIHTPKIKTGHYQLLTDISFVFTTGERSSSGLLEWESVNDAMEALAMMNHHQMKNPSK